MADQETIVFLHALLCDERQWAPQVETFREQYRVLTLDLPGHGDRGAPPSLSLDEVLHDVLDRLPDDAPLHWVGCSVGASVALRAARRFPQRVRSLTLLGCDAGPERFQLAYRALPWWLRTFGPRSLVPLFVRGQFGATTRRSQPALVVEWADRFATVNGPGVAAVMDALIRRSDYCEAASRIAVPTLVLAGEEDSSIRPAVTQRTAALIPNSVYRSIPRAGHLANLEQPKAFDTTLREFLAARVTVH